MAKKILLPDFSTRLKKKKSAKKKKWNWQFREPLVKQETVNLIVNLPL